MAPFANCAVNKIFDICSNTCTDSDLLLVASSTLTLFGTCNKMPQLSHLSYILRQAHPSRSVAAVSKDFGVAHQTMLLKLCHLRLKQTEAGCFDVGAGGIKLDEKANQTRLLAEADETKLDSEAGETRLGAEADRSRLLAEADETRLGAEADELGAEADET
ncbi:hypothetical protein PoB_007251100 [Plakobranchus ocellatus]|uniref:Uncharacterized protein n=1 Tax=Plakobranchus ocellatus TaxID=259542 RepID=A0AAV4DQ93_9GAST|nr:hypothetical protein PoB_007251100 [Plakobranchus ocellatus]